jgi:poly-gamma-glutamate synthesis protein (capsule biosynthesis protein)
MIRIGIAGDVMLGRLVDQYMLADPTRDPGSVWGDTLTLWHHMDLRMVNLECVIATAGEPWIPKVFHFRARPQAVRSLEAAGIHLVSLANNHVLDFGPDALRECLTRLRQSPLRYAGAGETIVEAAAPAVLTARGLVVAVVAVTDGEPRWEAGPHWTGTNYVRTDDEGLVEPYRTRVADSLARAREAAGLVIVSAHVGPNWGSPTPPMRALAHQLIDLGADCYWGHSNHTVQGIEIYRGRPILYSCGDFIDDYAVDPVARNDLSCFFELYVEDAKVRRILLHPVRLAGFQVSIATGGEVQWVHRWLADRMEECRTHVRPVGDLLMVEITA